MKGTFTVSLKRIIDSFNLEALYLPKDSSEIYISSSAVNRPGLELGGFFEHYNKNRIQILGRSETSVSYTHLDVYKRQPTINLKNPDEGLDLDYVPEKGREQELKYAISNSLGFGGHNATLAFKRFED